MTLPKALEEVTLSTASLEGDRHRWGLTGDTAVSRCGLEWAEAEEEEVDRHQIPLMSVTCL